MKNSKVELIILFFVVIICGLLIHMKLTRVEVGLNGQKTILIDYNANYIDPYVYVKRFNHLVLSSDFTVTTNREVDTSKIGENIIEYEIQYKGQTYHLKRTVKVVDRIKPELTSGLKEIKKEYCREIDTSKIEYSAIDEYDGDIKDKVNIEVTDEKVILSVKDASGNENTLELPIINEEQPDKKLVLNGYETIYVPLNGDYLELGAYIDDGCGISSEKVTIRGNVDTKTLGTYIIDYISSSGLKKTRKVTVYNPNTKYSDINDNEKVIYLTFDDGPGIYTRKILDTLKKYNVHATFFVTNQFPSYTYLIKDEYNEGHAIGVHTYTHYWNVYTSVDSYLEDFNKMNDVIASNTGVHTKIYRFPGGSSNTVSKNYALGVVSAIASKMNSLGYNYYDWNVDSQDASGAGSVVVYNSVVNGINYCTKCVVLMHDIKYSTSEALDNILNTLTRNGYKFGTLDENGPNIKHPINN